MTDKLNIAYHMPSIYTIYAQRTIYNGFKNAFLSLGHNFYTFTSDYNLERFLEEKEINVFITCSHHYYQKYLDFKLMKKYRDRGMKLFTKIDFWNSPFKKSNLNGVRSMKDDRKTVRLIKDGLLGDAFFHVVEHGDYRMDGFERETGYRYYTIPLAADKTLMSQDISNEFLADISYIGTNSSQKRHYFKEYVYPLRNEYYLRLYGQDWTLNDRLFGYVQRAGQYFNIPYARSFQKAKLNIEDEPKIYSSSKISINLHEEQQRKYGGDCNERTFKIPLYGGFEITDDVVCIRKYFKDGQEIIIAKDRKDWFEKIDYYIRNLDERNSIIKSGRNKVLENHTYHNRANLIIKIYKNLVGCS